MLDHIRRKAGVFVPFGEFLMFKRISLTTGLFLALSLPALAIPVEDASTALQQITAQGFHAPYELEFRHGYWVAESTSTEGLRVSVLVDPVTGEVQAIDRHGNGGLSAQRIKEIVRAAGYSRITDIEFDDGFWEVDAVDEFGREVELIVHPVTGALLNAPQDHGATPLTREQIQTALTAAGYTRIHDLEYDSDGYWEAEAVNPSGQRVELRIDPYTGTVLRESYDD